MSLVLRPEIEAEHAPRVTQAAAVGVAKALRSIEVPTGIKWPNDLLVEGRKICGILAAGHPDFTILGVGLNANLDPRDLGVPDDKVATVRSVLGRDVDETVLLQALLSHLDHELRRIKQFENILADWRKLDCTLGRKVRVQSSGGALEGLALDIDSRGALLLETGSGIVELFEGDVEYLRL
jgi:BirA family biotin operon repressor/biotin-[acetyl-CoA-carboxylase] ligase